MKPLWTQTLAWLAAVVVAILLALAAPDAMMPHGTAGSPASQGADTPR